MGGYCHSCGFHTVGPKHDSETCTGKINEINASKPSAGTRYISSAHAKLLKRKKKDAEHNDGRLRNVDTRADEKLIDVAELLKEVLSDLLELIQSIIIPPLRKNNMGDEIEDDGGDVKSDVNKVEEFQQK